VDFFGIAGSRRLIAPNSAEITPDCQTAERCESGPFDEHGLCRLGGVRASCRPPLLFDFSNSCSARLQFQEILASTDLSNVQRPPHIPGTEWGRVGMPRVPPERVKRCTTRAA
jgi:hypothetical protein